MCLQGFDQSGHEQSVSRSERLSGKSERPASLKTSSMLSGIRPARSCAMKIGCSDRQVISFSQSAPASVPTLTVTR